MYLYCDQNQLTALDLSHNTALQILTCNYNHLTAIDLTGLNALTSSNFNGSGQTASLTLVSAGSGSYSVNIALNDPDPSNLATGISYSSGVLTSTSNAITSTPFRVATNNVGRLSGTLNLSYAYTVTFAGENISISPQTVQYGALATQPETPTRTGYDFGGWFVDNNTFANQWDFDNDIITQDTTLYAKWNIKTFAVTFAGENISISPQNIEYGALATQPETPQRTGYDFGGWFVDNNTFANQWNFENDIITQDITLYAKWNIKTFTVTFAGENISISPQTVEYGALATQPETPQRTGYDFGGWFVDNNTFANQWNFENDIVTQDITLWAKWTETLGIETITNDEIQIYPNPVKDILIIENGELKIENVEITDLSGRIVVSCQSSVFSSINVSNLSQGAYFVKIYTDKGVVTKKIVKE
jgi:uncharacterized repeat protein (TIGR02543 family)